MAVWDCEQLAQETDTLERAGASPVPQQQTVCQPPSAV